MEASCRNTCGLCLEMEPERFCLNNARTINYADDYSDYSDDYEDETCATVEDYPIPIKKGKYSLYDSNGKCQVCYKELISDSYLIYPRIHVGRRVVVLAA